MPDEKNILSEEITVSAMLIILVYNVIRGLMKKGCGLPSLPLEMHNLPGLFCFSTLMIIDSLKSG